MLAKATKRICPSVSLSACSNTARHFGGLTNGSNPSATSISAKAPISSSQSPGPDATGYFFVGAVAEAPGPPLRSDWKNSLLGSTTIRSDLLRKLAR
jgi:hypothetical protein